MLKNISSFQQAIKYLEVYVVAIAITLAILSILYKDILLAEGSFKCVLVIGYLKIFRTAIIKSYLDIAKILIALAIITFFFYIALNTEDLWISLSIAILYSFITALMIADSRSLLLNEGTAFLIPFLILVIHEKDLLHLITLLTSYILSIAIVNKHSKLKQSISIAISRYISTNLKLVKYGETVYRDTITSLDIIRKGVTSFNRKISSFSKSIESKLYNVLADRIPRFFWKYSEIGKEVDGVVFFITLLFEKILSTAMKTETRISIQMSKLSSILARFEYFIEHSFLAILIMAMLLLIITITFYLIYLS
jgi:hypothetical protein